MNMTRTLSEVEAWPIENQLQFVQLLWDKIADAGWQPVLTDAQKVEFDRRLDALDSNPNDVITWDAITDFVRRKR